MSPALVNSSHTLATLDVAPGSLVLDIGAGDGTVAGRLVERGCRVVGVEIDPEAARRAEPHCERLLVGDVETIDLDTALKGWEFDAVLLLDVLEYVRDPAALLTAAARRLKPGGRLIISAMNVTHAAVRLRMLAGHFSPAETEAGHGVRLHFFDRDAVERLLQTAGLGVLDRLRTTAGLTDTAIVIDPSTLPADAVAFALADHDADTYQFVYVAAPAPHRATGIEAASLGETLQRRADDAERRLEVVAAGADALAVRVSALEQERDDFVRRDAASRERSEWLEAELGRRMRELDSRHDDLEHARLDLAVKDAQLADAAAQLVHVRSALDAPRRLADRVTAASERRPAVRRALRRLAALIPGRG